MLTIDKNGHFRVLSRDGQTVSHGTWTASGSACKLIHDSGEVDTLALMRGGETLAGSSDRGVRLYGRRVTLTFEQLASSPIVGSWAWPPDRTLVIRADHTYDFYEDTQKRNTGRWEAMDDSGKHFVLHHAPGGGVLKLVLTDDGRLEIQDGEGPASLAFRK